MLEKDTNSIFNFTTTLGIFGRDYIKYELGIGVSDNAEREKRTLTLFGKWNLKKDTGVTFEVRYENKQLNTILFGARARLTDRDTVSLKLTNDVGKDIGIEIELSHEILKGDSHAFLRLLKSRKEAAIYAGAAWRW